MTFIRPSAFHDKPEGLSTTSLTTPSKSAPSEEALRKKAQEFEASFLSQMLQQAKIGMPDDGGSDNLVTQNFSSFMSKAYADQIVKAGGVGLSESIFQALHAKAH